MNRAAGIAIVFALVLLIGAPLFVSAATGAASAIPGIPYWGPLVSCTGDYANTGSPSGAVTAKCTSLCDIFKTIQNVIYFAMTVALFAIAPVFIVVGGIMMLMAGGSPERFKKGGKIVSGTFIGLAIVLGAFLIVNTFLYILGNPKGSGVSWPNITCSVQPYTP